MLALLLSVPLAAVDPVQWPRMNLEMHLRLNLELASNEFLTEFAFKIRKIPSKLALVRQCTEQATLGRTHASVGGHALPPHPLILKWLHPAPPTHTPPPLPQSSQVVQSTALFAGMKSENPRSILLSSVYNVL